MLKRNFAEALGLLALVSLATTPLLLGGCATVSNLMPPSPKTAAQTVYEIKAGLVSGEDAALAYEATVCGIPTPGVPCTKPGAAAINQAVISADAAVNAAEKAVKNGSSAAAPIADALAAVQALQAIVQQYAPSPTSATSASSAGAVK